MIAFAVQPWKPALMTLESGDLLITGTPEGVTPSGHFPHLREGDVVELEGAGRTPFGSAIGAGA
jgi:2-keto-4-pentenoate hydratase/2-oxohepta-3-ene-1,7-dioic acid hydratase in catechol pathway